MSNDAKGQSHVSSTRQVPPHGEQGFTAGMINAGGDLDLIARDAEIETASFDAATVKRSGNVRLVRALVGAEKCWIHPIKRRRSCARDEIKLPTLAIYSERSIARSEDRLILVWYRGGRDQR